MSSNLTHSVDAYLALESVIIWWNDSYPYRHHLRVTGPTLNGKPAFPPVNLKSLFSNGKTRSDYKDVVIVHLNDQLAWTVVGSVISNDYLEFPVISDLGDGVVDDGYYIFYGNHKLTNAPLNPLYKVQEWPDSALVDDSKVSYTRPGEHWIQGSSNTPRAKATFVFNSNRIRLISAMGPDWGIAEVQVDNNPPVQIDLYSAYATTDNIIFESKNLSSGIHYIRTSVTGEKNPLSTNTSINIQKFQFRNPITIVDLGEESDILHWGGATSGS